MVRSLVLFVAVLVSSDAFAGVSPQAIVKVTGSTPVTKKTDFTVFGSAFLVPGADPFYFLYTGPGFQLTDWWWTSPRVGMVMNWPTYGDAAPIYSVWNSFSLRDGDISFFTETEIYQLHGGGSDYYGLYWADFNVKSLSLGAHVEQVDDHVTIGPHVLCALNEHFVAGVEHHWDFDDGHAIRTTIKLKFN